MGIWVLLLMAYVGLHYLFASQSAHIAALYSPFLAVMIQCGISPVLSAMSLAYIGNTFTGMTHYASAESVIYFSSRCVAGFLWYSTHPTMSQTPSASPCRPLVVLLQAQTHLAITMVRHRSVTRSHSCRSRGLRHIMRVSHPASFNRLLRCRPACLPCRYYTVRAVFGVGFVMTLFNLLLWIGLGLGWWKAVGFYSDIHTMQ